MGPGGSDLPERSVRSKGRRATPGQLNLFDGPVLSADEELATSPPSPDESLRVAAEARPLTDTSPDPGAPSLEGSVRAPRRWEELLIESQVVAGAERWRRRLDGLAHEYSLRLGELRRDEGDDSARVLAVTRDARRLDDLRRFALPVIDEI